MEIFKLQSLNLSDAEQLTALSVQLGYGNDFNLLFERTKKIIETADNCVFVAKSGDKIVGWIHGFIALRIETPLFVEIAGLVVSQDFRKQHIGKNLINAVKEWSISVGIYKVRLRCNVIRTESHKFYKNLGFEQNKQQMVFEMDI
ncbi:GNAT family N-acetyltransferase [Pedobacter sp. Hv1]|uniref:GNAT family N-acetyltransferase n=1 Tax=Pedobacter sp. Hv1 TaxID=1740090 RepID=UPI0006D8C354|nr:GNAT family N-acetyltransferase [Pedobacter sp. Hv1]KQB99734.1 hypothetical protein AQF98_14500 [Pedobacter sp. Hv1]